MTGKINFNVIHNYDKISSSLRLFFSIFCVAQKLYQKNDGALGNLTLSQKNFAQAFDISRQTVSKRLAIFHNADILTYFNGGNLVINSLFFDGECIDITSVKNFRSLNTGVQLLFLILLCTRSDGTIGIDKGKFLEYLKITWICAKTYLRELGQANVLKWRYTGEIAVNPDFFYTGEKKDLNAIRQNYIKFKSII